MVKQYKDIDILAKKMDIIIALLFKISNDGSNITLREQIAELSGLGLITSEIASILNKNPKYISKELSIINKEK